MLVQQWLYPVLHLTLQAYPPTQEEVTAVKLLVAQAMDCTTITHTVDILSQPEEAGGVGLWHPKAYCHWARSLSPVRWLREPNQFGREVNDTINKWATKVGMTPSSTLFKLAPWTIQSNALAVAPPLAHSLRSYSICSKTSAYVCGPGVGDDVEQMPIWHNKLFQKKNGHTYFNTRLVAAGITRVGDVWTRDEGYHQPLFDLVPKEWQDIYLWRP